jgi:hypothetical protein
VWSWFKRNLDYDYISQTEFKEEQGYIKVTERVYIDGDVPISFFKRILIRVVGMYCSFALRKRNKIVIKEVESLG